MKTGKTAKVMNIIKNPTPRSNVIGIEVVPARSAVSILETSAHRPANGRLRRLGSALAGGLSVLSPRSSSKRAFFLAALAPSLVAPNCFAAEEEVDYHFRPFWVEPADRVELGSGHLVGGVDHERHPARGSKSRTSMPLEATLGIGYGFSTVLAFDGGSRSVFDDNSTSSSANRAAKLRYSFPEWNGVNFLIMTGVDRPAGSQASKITNGFSTMIDTAVGTIGIGQLWERKRPEDLRAGQETGVNFFRTGLGSDGKWALGGEMRYARTADNENLRRWLVGAGRVIAHGVMADFAIGSTLQHSDTRRVTAGLSWFF